MNTHAYTILCEHLDKVNISPSRRLHCTLVSFLREKFSVVGPSYPFLTYTGRAVLFFIKKCPIEMFKHRSPCKDEYTELPSIHFFSI